MGDLIIPLLNSPGAQWGIAELFARSLVLCPTAISQSPHATSAHCASTKNPYITSIYTSQGSVGQPAVVYATYRIHVDCVTWGDLTLHSFHASSSTGGAVLLHVVLRTTQPVEVAGGILGELYFGGRHLGSGSSDSCLSNLCGAAAPNLIYLTLKLHCQSTPPFVKKLSIDPSSVYATDRSGTTVFTAQVSNLHLHVGLIQATIPGVDITHDVNGVVAAAISKVILGPIPDPLSTTGHTTLLESLQSAVSILVESTGLPLIGCCR